jgi:hypothetical protein
VRRAKSVPHQQVSAFDPVASGTIDSISVGILRTTLSVLLCLPALASPDWVKVDKTGSGFVFAQSGAKFTPWGYNYFRDESYRLLEDYWNDEGPQGWAKFDRDFREMKRLGANVVRLHLQFAKFMDSPGKPDQQNLARLSKVIDLAEELGVYLDITGLGTYRLKDVPAWYRNASEREHWAMQAEFWEAVARVCANRPTVFAYNLMNEPLATNSKRPAGQWTNPTALHGQTYIEYINLDPANSKPPEIARAWIRQMVAAIRRHDQRHLITVGLIWVSTVNPEVWSGFPPKEISPDLDFLAVHVYPERGQINIAVDSLRRYQVGKPVVVEETFPMNSSPAEWRMFLESSRGLAQGWLGQYWSLSPKDIEGSDDIVNKLLRGQFEVLQSLNPNR